MSEPWLTNQVRRAFNRVLSATDVTTSPISTVSQQEQHERIAKALADPQRFAIFEHICRHSGGACGEVGCKSIVARFSVSQATISHHLKELQHAGLIEGRREGQCLMLVPCRGAVEAYVGHLQSRLLAK